MSSVYGMFAIFFLFVGIHVGVALQARAIKKKWNFSHLFLFSLLFALTGGLIVTLLSK